MPRIPTLINNADGSVRAVNLKRLNECPYFILTNSPNNALVIPANQAVQQTIMSVSGEGPAAIHAFAAQRTGACRVFMQIQDGARPRGLMNGGCHIDTIFGNYLAGSRSYFLPEALYVDETRAVVITLTDISAAPNTVRLSLEAQRLLTRYADHSLSRVRDRMEKRQYLTMPYFYTFDGGFVDALGPAGTVTNGTITIGQDSHFQLMQLTAVATSGLGSFDLNITDVGTGESIINAPLSTNFAVSSGVIVGNAAFPYRFHEPIFYERHTKLLVAITNRVAGTNRVFLTLGGRAIADRLWN